MKNNTLIVEDDEAIASLIENHLLESGIGTIKKITGKDALSVLKTNREIQSLIIDNTLPDCQGSDLIKEIKEKYPALFIILITGSENKAIKDQALKNGASYHVTKDTAIKFLSTLERLLQHGDNQETNKKLELNKRQFVKNAKNKIDLLEKWQKNILCQNYPNQQELNDLFITIHNISGSAKIFDFGLIGKKANEAEDAIYLLKNDSDYNFSKPPIYQELAKRLKSLSNQINQL